MNDESVYFPDGMLAQSTVIGGLNPEFLIHFESLARRIELVKGQSLFLQDDLGDAMYIVETGSIEISVVGEDGKKLSLNIMRPRDVFGEIAALDGGLRTASASAWESSSLFEIKRSKIQEAISSSPEFSAEIIRILCGRVRWTSQQVEGLALLELEPRLARLLLMLNTKGLDNEGWMRISQSEVADFLSVTRETINKILQSWLTAKLIRKSRGRIKIVEVQGLKQLGKVR